MTAVCGRDGQWTPNPGNVTCSPRQTQILIPGENELLLSHNPASYFKIVCCKFTTSITSWQAVVITSLLHMPPVITAVVSCIVSFITGALVGVVVYYCTLRKKSNSHKIYLPKKGQQQPVYADIVGQSQNIEVKENVAYGPVQQ